MSEDCQATIADGPRTRMRLPLSDLAVTRIRGLWDRLAGLGDRDQASKGIQPGCAANLTPPAGTPTACEKEAA